MKGRSAFRRIALPVFPRVRESDRNPCARVSGLRHAAYSDIDMSAETENLLLEAALGMGAVWLGIAPLKERIGAVRKIIGASGELGVDCLEPDVDCLELGVNCSATA